MLLERGEYNYNTDINSNHNYSGKDFDIYNEINSLKPDQSTNREFIQTLTVQFYIAYCRGNLEPSRF